MPNDRPCKRRRCTHGDDKKNCHFELWWAPEGEENPYFDWTIVVESKNKKRSFTVHQKVLECKSDYFASIFQGKFSEASNQCSHFEFDNTIVERFDSFLDSLYAFNYLESDGCKMFRDTNAHDEVVFTYLLDYFQVTHLLEESSEFASDNMEIRGWPCMLEFYRALRVLPFSVPRLQNILCSSGAFRLQQEEHYSNVGGNVSEGSSKRLFLKEATSNNDFLMHLCQHEVFERHKREYGSCLLFILKLRPTGIPLDDFVKLTSVDNLLCLEPKISLGLLKLCSKYDTSDTEIQLATALHTFEARCLQNIRTIEQEEPGYGTLRTLGALYDCKSADVSEKSASTLAAIQKTCTDALAEHMVTGVTLRCMKDFIVLYPFLKQRSPATCLLRKFAVIGQFPLTVLPDDCSSFFHILQSDAVKAKRAIAAKGGAVPLQVQNNDHFPEKDGRYVYKSDNVRSQMSRDRNGTWILESRGRYYQDTSFYTSADRSDYGDNFPPFTGWKRLGASDGDVALLIHF